MTDVSFKSYFAKIEKKKLRLCSILDINKCTLIPVMESQYFSTSGFDCEYEI